MKIKNFFELLGFKRKPKRYGYTVDELAVPGLGSVRYAQWQHPLEYKKSVTAAEVDCYRKFINEGDFCIDIGAHTGDSTFSIAFAAGKTGAVLALEPNPYIFPVLEKNARMNRDKISIKPILAAAAEKEGEIVFEYTDCGFYNGGRHEAISAFRHGRAYKLSVHGIDLAKELQSDFQNELPRLKYIKVDAEGYDLSVVISLGDVIEKFRPYMRVEVYKKTSPAYRSRLVRFFLERAYDVFTMAEEPFVPGEMIKTDRIDNKGHYDILCVPKYQK